MNTCTTGLCVSLSVWERKIERSGQKEGEEGRENVREGGEEVERKSCLRRTESERKHTKHTVPWLLSIFFFTGDSCGHTLSTLGFGRQPKYTHTHSYTHTYKAQSKHWKGLRMVLWAMCVHFVSIWNVLTVLFTLLICSKLDLQKLEHEFIFDPLLNWIGRSVLEHCLHH